MATIQTDTLDIDISKLLNKLKTGKISAEQFEKAIIDGMKKGNSESKKLAKGVDGVSKNLKKGKVAGDSFLLSMVQFSVVSGIFNGIKRSIGSALRGIIDYNKEMAKLIAITNASKSEQKELRTTAENLGESTAFTASQVVVLMQEYAKLGFTAKQINEMSSATVDLSVFTEDVALTAETAGGSIKAFGLQAKDSQRVIDLMAKSFNTTSLNLTRYYEAAKDGFPILDAFGASIEDGTAVMGALAESMVTGSRAGTGIKTVFSDIRDGSSKVAKVLGGTAQNMDEFVELLEAANAKGKSFADEALVDLDKRSKAVILGLVKQVEKLKELRVVYQEVDGTAKKMADDAIDSLAGSFTLLNSAISGIVNEKGKGLYNIFNNILKDSIKVVKFLGENIVKVGTVALMAILMPALKITYGWLLGLSAKVTIATGGFNLLFAAISAWVASKIMKSVIVDQESFNNQLKDFNDNAKLYIKNLKDMSPEILAKNIKEATEKLKDYKRQLRLSPEDTGLKEEIENIKKLSFELQKENLGRVIKGWGSSFNNFIKTVQEEQTKARAKELAEVIAHQKKVMEARTGTSTSTELRKVEFAKPEPEQGNAELSDQFIQDQAMKLESIKGLDQLKKEIDADELTRKKDFNEQITEDLAESTAEQMEIISESINVISELQNGISDIFSQISTNEMIALDNKYKKEKDNINKNIKDEGAKAKALEKLDKKYEEDKRKQQKKTAEMNKITALLNVVINTAQGVMSAMAMFPPNPILAGIIGAMGATQAGVIAAQPIPEYAIGGVGINGAGSGTSDSILARISNGESVVTARGTASGDNSSILRNINNGQTFVNAGSSMGGVEKKLDRVANLLAEQGNPQFNIDNTFDRDGITTGINETNSNFNNNNNRDEQADI